MMDLVNLAIGLILGALCITCGGVVIGALRRIERLEAHVKLHDVAIGSINESQSNMTDSLEAVDRDVGRLAMHVGISRNGGAS